MAVPSTQSRDDERQYSVDRASFDDEEQLGTRSGSGVARQPSWEEQGEVSITDVKPSHWYNVRHRFSWRKRAGAEGPDEVGAVGATNERFAYVLFWTLERCNSADTTSGAWAPTKGFRCGEHENVEDLRCYRSLRC